MFQMMNMNDTRPLDLAEGLTQNYSPRLRAVILFSGLIGSWAVVAAAGYLFSRFM